MTLSPSSREAWIEIFVEGGAYAATGSRLPHGRRGLKSMNPKTEEIEEGRLPHGRRGLKFLDLIEKDNIEKGRLPHGRRGLKCQRLFLASYTPESPSSREAWIEISIACCFASRASTSPSSREAWIEIAKAKKILRDRLVAFLTGGVD